MPVSRPIAMGLLLLVAQFSASAADLAILKNGASIPFLRKEQAGTMTRLYVPGGHMDIPTAEIASFDKDDSPLEDVTPVSQPNPAAQSVSNVAVQPVAVPAAQPLAATPASVKPAGTMQVLAPAQVNIDQLVREASSRYRLDPDFVSSVIKAESNFNAHAVSPKGARGLMQLMPQTAASLGVTNAFDPKANVEAGTAHLSTLLDQYNNDPIKALAAYNAGAHRVEQYHGVPPYRETRAYVAKIVRDFNAKKRAQMKAAGATKTASAANTAGTTAAAANSKASRTHSAQSTKKPAKTQPQQASASKPAKPA